MNAHPIPPKWRVGGGSVRGLAHARSGRPNQDAFFCREPGAADDVAVMLADGHGASVHFRSDRGAQMAVEAASDALTRYNGDADFGGIEALPILLLTSWRNRVAGDIAWDPPSGETGVPGAAYAAYGSTLLAAAITDHELTLAQIGDGDLLLVFADGSIGRPLATDVGLVGEQTYSLCMDDADRYFRTASIWRGEDMLWPTAVVLTSDGVSKSFRDEASFLRAIADLTAHARADWDQFQADLPRWLQSLSDHGSGDDATLAMLLVGQSPLKRTGRETSE